MSDLLSRIGLFSTARWSLTRVSSDIWKRKAIASDEDDNFVPVEIALFLRNRSHTLVN